jgi:pyrroline-5-carboxylate reductase
MAGIKIKTISASLKIKTEIIRVMPNLASELGLGVNCIYHNKNINHRYLKNIKKLLKELGSVYVLKNEKLIDAVTAISGSGPAYFFLFFLVFESIAKEIGFNKEEARNLIIDTALGSLELVKHEVNIRALINSVKSKGGTTEAALKVLEKNNKGLYNLMKSAINAANKRAQQLSKVN